MFSAQLFKLLWMLPVISGIQQEKADKIIFFLVLLNCSKNIQTPACSFKLDKWFWSSSKKPLGKLFIWLWIGSDSLTVCCFMKVYCDAFQRLRTSRSFFSIIRSQIPEECLGVAEVYGATHYNNDNTQRLSPPGSRPIHPYKMDHREEYQETWSSWKNLNRNR